MDIGQNWGWVVNGHYGAILSGRVSGHLHLETEMRKRHRLSVWAILPKYISTCCDNSSQHDRYKEGNVEERLPSRPTFTVKYHWRDQDLHVIYQYSFWYASLQRTHSNTFDDVKIQKDRWNREKEKQSSWYWLSCVENKHCSHEYKSLSGWNERSLNRIWE